MPQRQAVTLVELLIVLAILGGMLALLLPAVQSARAKAREAVCKNNLHQLNLAVGGYVEAHRELPPRTNPEIVGGWAIEILPHLEHRDLRDAVSVGTAVTAAPAILHRPPAIFICPTRDSIAESRQGVLMPAHYALSTSSGRESYSLLEVPLERVLPWASGPELIRVEAFRMTGPHRGGFFYANGFQQGVSYQRSSGG